MTRWKITYYKEGKLDVRRTVMSYSSWYAEFYFERAVDKYKEYSNKTIDYNES